MRAALYTEGPSDAAVITNILKGVLNIDRSDIRYDLPELEKDETDLHNQRVEKFSNWTLVKNECIERKKIDLFLDNFDDNRFVIIQIDTAERNSEGYDITFPKNSKNLEEYSIELRTHVINKINEWLNNHHINKIAYAICIEETEAWLLTRFNIKADTSQKSKPKEHFNSNWHQLYSKKEQNKLKNLISFEQYLSHSNVFRKTKDLNILRANNKSLDAFCENLEIFR